MDLDGKRILVTGGYGFIGSHFIKYLLKTYPNTHVINVDKMTYAACKKNLSDLNDDGTAWTRYGFYKFDISNFKQMEHVIGFEKPDIVVNFAAESDNNKATKDPTSSLEFSMSNVLGVHTLAALCTKFNVKRFHHISTCEVYGQMSLGVGEIPFYEHNRLCGRTPYSASKGAGDLVAMSYYETFGLPVTISRCCNNYGTHQFPEKVIPRFITQIMQDEPLTVFKSSQNKREWLHVLDHCRAVDLILQKGLPGQVYNVGSGFERSVSELVRDIIEEINKPLRVREVEDRPGHDSRYLLGSEKIRNFLKWEPQVNWYDGLHETIRWYEENESWWRPLLTRSNSDY